MKTPKILEKIARENNLEVIPIAYNFSGIKLKRKGFDLVRKESFRSIDQVVYKRIVCEIEPVDFSTGAKWYLRTVPKEYSGKMYFKKISMSMFKDIDFTKNSLFVIQKSKNGKSNP